jgi:hypothetical protein
MPTYEARRLNDRESTAPAKFSTRTLKKERAGRRYDARNLTIDPGCIFLVVLSTSER